ncbi:hypothetical protein T09_4522 [Trichinella sp. T9]|nr:hypothetical protein T09_4522 [Trichinella sp. T9]
MHVRLVLERSTANKCNVIYKDIQYTTVKVSNQQASSILTNNIIYNKRVSSVFQFVHIPLPHDIKQHIV